MALGLSISCLNGISQVGQAADCTQVYWIWDLGLEVYWIWDLGLEVYWIWDLGLDEKFIYREGGRG